MPMTAAVEYCDNTRKPRVLIHCGGRYAPVKIFMKMTSLAATILLAECAVTGVALAQPKPRPIPTGPASVIESQPNVLFNGWKLTPAGRHVGVNAMPLKMAL